MKPQMKKTRLSIKVKCWRCGKVARTNRANGLPKHWDDQEVYLCGFIPAHVKLCPKCKKANL